MFLKLVSICIIPEVGLAWVLLEDVVPFVLRISANILVALITSTATTMFATSAYLYEQMAS